jgi:fumarylacetoacetate (FAA) hydrolase
MADEDFMKLATFLLPDSLHEIRLGAIVADDLIDLGVAQSWAQGAKGLALEALPRSMHALIGSGPAAWETVRHLVRALDGEDLLGLKGAGRAPVAHKLGHPVLLAPLLRPVSLRDFYAFERHVARSFANRERPIPQEWYRWPVFYYTNAQSVYGPDQTVPYPWYSQALDYELEIACIIGKAGRDIKPEEAAEHIFGYTIFNDWSARDVQREEMQVGLGPAKGKDFAASLGPWIVTPDELEAHTTDRAGVYDLGMTAMINGELRSQGNWSELHYSFGEMIARASQEVTLLPGEVLGSGTVGSGCLLELTQGEGPWLSPGDVVELRIEGLGRLLNRVGPKRQA